VFAVTWPGEIRLRDGDCRDPRGIGSGSNVKALGLKECDGFLEMEKMASQAMQVESTTSRRNPEIARISVES